MASLQELANIIEGLRQIVDGHTAQIGAHREDIDKLPDFDEKMQKALTELKFEQNEQRSALATTQDAATNHLREIVTRVQNEFGGQQNRIILVEQEVLKLQRQVESGGTSGGGVHAWGW